jgi:hypothetical protein
MVDLPKIKNTPSIGGTRQNIKNTSFDSVKIAEDKARNKLESKKQACLSKGWFWDEATQTCNPNPNFKVDFNEVTKDNLAPSEQPKGAYNPEKKGFVTDTGEFYPTSNPDFRPGQVDRKVTFNPDNTVTVMGADNQPVTLSQEEYKTYLSGSGALTSNVQQAQAQPNMQQMQAQQLAGQVGQIGQLPVSPTGLDYGEAATVGIIGAIPRALSYALSGAAAGILSGGAAGSIIPGAGTAAGAGAGAIIGAVGGFAAGISGSIISNLKSQRSDTTTAQQRVLDEGKQNLNDWATLAATDPTQRPLAIARFNQQLALIDQAYRQMKLDTSRDVAKFETALPNLAEFETFYSAQGERDFLVARMFQSLQVQQDPEFIYQMQEMADRRLNEKK